MENKDVRVAMYLSPQLAAKLKAYAEREELSVSAAMQTLLKKCLEEDASAG